MDLCTDSKINGRLINFQLFHTDKMCEKTSNGCRMNLPLTDEIIQHSGLPFNTRTLKHHLDLMLAHQIRPHATTFHDEWIMTDYIFYTKFKRRSPNVRRMPQYSCLQLLKRLDPPTIKECSQIGKIPNKGIPSDHFFLAAEFVLMFYRWRSSFLRSPSHSLIIFRLQCRQTIWALWNE